LDKWIAVVGKPDWKPKKTSRICSLHFNESDIIQGMGYQRFNLRKSAVPKDYSSIVFEKEQIDIAMLKSKEIYDPISVSKSIISSETCVLDKSAAHDHDYLKNNDSTMIKNDGSNTYGTQDPNRSVQKVISYPDKKHKLIQTDSKEIIAANINKSVNSSEICVLDENAAWDHNYSKDNITMIENDGSNIYGIQDLNQSAIQKAIFYPDQKRKFIQIGLKYIIVPISQSSTNVNYKIRKEIDFINATKKINELSRNVKDMKIKNRTLQQKLRRYNEKVTLIKELFDQLQQEKLISGDSLQLIKKQLERLTLRTFQNKIKTENQLKRKN